MEKQMNYDQQVAHYKAVRSRIGAAAPMPPQMTIEPEPEEKPRRKLSVQKQIISDCADEFGVTVADILSPSRKKNFVIARRKIAWTLYKRGTFSLNQIGRLMNRDHTTILHSIRAYKNAQNPPPGE